MTHRAWASLSARTASANPGATGPASRAAALAISAWALVMMAVTILAHPTPLYFDETDQIGEYIPAARPTLGLFGPRLQVGGSGAIMRREDERRSRSANAVQLAHRRSAILAAGNLHQSVEQEEHAVEESVI